MNDMQRAVLRDVLSSARAVLITASADKPEDLRAPERQSVIKHVIERINLAFAIVG